MSNTNRLSRETSPYLLQHQHNPVDWYPWGEEAFAAARAQNKPIFLSVGYSTCYWCHVMERQCFEVESIAAEMNQRFITIKVDREERPDVDQLYMTAVQVLTRHGGWPMSVFLTPDLRPFYGGTYFPPTDQHGRPGFVTLLRALEDAYKNRKTDVDQSASQITSILQQLANPAAPSRALTIDDDFLQKLIHRSVADYDPHHGGFGSAPKFPRQTLLELLLINNRNSPSDTIEKMLRHTLDAMALGGIHDHLGGGFHRYSTDERWLVPHFEIMLYDNAMLAWCYVEAFAQTQQERYAVVARDVFDFVLREMTSPQGGFYTAMDAEVDGQEGLSYLWSRAEVVEILGKPDADLFCRTYGLDDGPNFADPHHGDGRPEKNILFLTDLAALEDPKLRPMRQKLYDLRQTRKQPLLDTKIITSWNALMIRALAHGAAILKEPKYLNAARKAADFLLKSHRTSDGGLYRASRDGITKYAGFHDDYAFLIQALLTLEDHQSAATLTKVMIENFGDPAGGFYFTTQSATDLIVRQKISSDSPLPSGNAIAAMVLNQQNQDAMARQTITAFAEQLSANAEGMSSMLQAALLHVQKHGTLAVSPDQKIDQADRPLSPGQLADQVLTIKTRWQGSQTLLINLAILHGFHIYAHDVSGGLSATALAIQPQPTSIEYPPAQQQTFAFADNPIGVYTGEATIKAHFTSSPPPGSKVSIALTFQPCDDQACLPITTKHAQTIAP